MSWVVTLLRPARFPLNGFVVETIGPYADAAEAEKARRRVHFQHRESRPRTYISQLQQES